MVSVLKRTRQWIQIEIQSLNHISFPFLTRIQTVPLRVYQDEPRSLGFQRSRVASPRCEFRIMVWGERMKKREATYHFPQFRLTFSDTLCAHINHLRNLWVFVNQTMEYDSSMCTSVALG